MPRTQLRPATPYRGEYADVPPADAAEVDPHWLELQRPGALPAAYLPPSMPGPHSRWRKGAAWVLVTLLVSATAGGICLTYGPAELFRLLEGRS